MLREESPARHAIDAPENILQGGRLTRGGIGEARRRGGGGSVFATRVLSQAPTTVSQGLPRIGFDVVVPRGTLGAVAGAAQRPKRSVFATLDATGAGSWAAATPKRVTERTTEIIDGGGSEWW